MKDAWGVLVNHQATGTFFEEESLEGSCYIGGTPIGLATKLGSGQIIRFLALEVGCECKQCWDALVPGRSCFVGGWRGAEAGGAGAAAREAPECLYGDPSTTPRVETLRSWQAGACAYMDVTDHYGNTPSHVAVMTHSDLYLLSYLGTLHAAGYGRHDHGAAAAPADDDDDAAAAPVVDLALLEALQVDARVTCMLVEAPRSLAAADFNSMLREFLKVGHGDSTPGYCHLIHGALGGVVKALPSHLALHFGVSSSCAKALSLYPEVLRFISEEAPARDSSVHGGLPKETVTHALRLIVKDLSLDIEAAAVAPADARAAGVSDAAAAAAADAATAAVAASTAALLAAAAAARHAKAHARDAGAIAAAGRAAHAAGAAFAAACSASSLAAGAVFDPRELDSLHPAAALPLDETLGSWHKPRALNVWRQVQNLPAVEGLVLPVLALTAPDIDAREFAPPDFAALFVLEALKGAHAAVSDLADNNKSKVALIALKTLVDVAATHSRELKVANLVRLASLSVSAASASAAAAVAAFRVPTGRVSLAPSEACAAAAADLLRALAPADPALTAAAHAAEALASVHARAAVGHAQAQFACAFELLRKDIVFELASRLTTLGKRKVDPPPSLKSTLSKQKVEVDLHGSPTVYHALGLHDHPIAAGNGAARGAAARVGLGAAPAHAVTQDTTQEVVAAAAIALKQQLCGLAERSAMREDKGERPNHLEALNADGLTPFTLAVRLGKRELFESIWLQRSKQVWTYGLSSGVCAHLYPLDMVDDIGEVYDSVKEVALSPAPQPQPEFSDRRDALTIASLEGFQVTADLKPQLFKPVWYRRKLKLAKQPADDATPQPAGASPQPAGAAKQPAVAAQQPKGGKQQQPEDSDPPEVPKVIGAKGLFTPPVPRPHEPAKVEHANWLKVLAWWFPVPMAILGGGERPRPRQLTCEDVLVRYDQWCMLEPVDKDVTLEKQFTYGSAVLAALGVKRAKNRDENLDGEKMERVFTGLLSDANRLLHPNHHRSASGLDGSIYVKKDATSILEQLSERKWTRLYAPRFYRLAVFRLLYCAMVWAYLSLRVCTSVQASEGMARVPFAPYVPLCDGITGAEVAVFVALAGAFFFVHAARFVVLGLLPWLQWKCKRWVRDPGGAGWWALPHAAHQSDELKRKTPRPLRMETRESALYVSAHCGRFGVFHVSTMLLGSLLLTAGGLIDLLSGWAQAYLVYTSGAFFFTVHLLYFLLGWEYTGPLIVMVFSVINTEFFRWLCLFAPMLLVFGLPLFVLNRSAWAPAAGGNATDTLQQSLASFSSMLGVVMDNSQNTYQAGVVPGIVGRGANTPGSTLLIVLLWVVCLFVCTITLMALLIAMFGRAFEAQADRGADFVSAECSAARLFLCALVQRPLTRLPPPPSLSPNAQLIERMRANMMLESLQTIQGRFHVRPRDRYWLMNKPPKVSPSGRVPGENHLKSLAERPYFFNLQPVPPETALHIKSRTMTRKALGRSAGTHFGHDLEGIFEAKEESKAAE